MSLTAIIVDDEQEAIKGLTALLENFCPEVQVLGCVQSALEAAKALKVHQPDVLFLDINMPNGTGFDLLEAIEEPPITIFVTAHDDHAIRALRLKVLDYLVKPIDPEDLVAAVKSAEQQIALQQTGARIAAAEPQLDALADRLAVPSQDGLQFVPLQSIVRLQSSNNYTYIHLVGQKPMLASKTLKHFERELENRGFLRVHQQHLVNVHHIVSLSRKEGGAIGMSSGESIPISRSKMSEVSEFLRPGG